MSIRAHLGDVAYEALLSACIRMRGGAQLRAALRKDAPRIAFLGGSVTYGYRPGTEDTSDCFPNLVLDALQRSGIAAVGENYGISGTGCITGALLTEHYLYTFLPDIVFVEYGINESFNRAGMAYADGLLRKLLAMPHRPSVVLISVSNQQGYSSEAMFETLAETYQLSHLTFRTGLYPLFEAGTLPWELYSTDAGHPLPAGHRLIADAVLKLFSQTDADSGNTAPDTIIQADSGFAALTPIPREQISATGFVYENTMLHRFPSVWRAQQDGQAALYTELYCSTIVLVFIQDSDPDWATAAVEIDGRQVDLLQSRSMFGWHNPCCRVVLDAPHAAKHHLSIRRLAEDSRKQFLLLEIAADIRT